MYVDVRLDCEGELQGITIKVEGEVLHLNISLDAQNTDLAGCYSFETWLRGDLQGRTTRDNRC